MRLTLDSEAMVWVVFDDVAALSPLSKRPVPVGLALA